MVFCKKCGHQNEDGQNYCENCGERLSIIELANQENNMPGYLKGVIGDKNVIAGDIATTVNTNTTYINNDEAKSTEKCYVCGRVLSKGSGQLYKCSKCDNFVCEDHIDPQLHICQSCKEKAEYNREMDAFLPFEYEQRITGMYVIKKLRDKSAMDIKVPEMVESIAEGAFSESRVVRVSLPNSLVEIGRAAFKDCKLLRQINLPVNLCYIESEAFFGCERLEILIPNHIEVGENVTYGTATYRKGEEIRRKAEEETRRKSEAEARRKAEEAARRRAEAEARRKAEEEARRMAEAEAIRKAEEDARRRAEAEARRKAEEDARRRAEAEARRKAEEDAKRKEEEAEKRRKQEKFEHDFCIDGDALIRYRGNDFDVIIPEGIRTIRKDAFAYSNIKNLTLPNSLSEICRDAFREASVKNIFIADIKAWCSILFGYKANPLSFGANLYINGSLVKKLIIPRGVCSVADNAFYGYKELVSVELPSDFVHIGKFAFYDCSNITSVSICDGLKEIGASAFESCSKLCRISIPNSVIKIGESAFKDCLKLTDVSVPLCVEEVCASTFENCSSIIRVSIPDSVKKINATAFRNCSSLTDISIPDSVQEMGVAAFENCTSLIKVSIPKSTTKINADLFKGCHRLSGVRIHKRVTDIYNGAFEGTSNLTIKYGGTRRKFHRINSICSGVTQVVCSDGELLLKAQTEGQLIDKHKRMYFCGLAFSLLLSILLEASSLFLPESIGIIFCVASATVFAFWLIVTHNDFRLMELAVLSRFKKLRLCKQPRRRGELDFGNRYCFKMNYAHYDSADIIDIIAFIVLIVNFILSFFYPEKFSLCTILFGIVWAFNLVLIPDDYLGKTLLSEVSWRAIYNSDGVQSWVFTTLYTIGISASIISLSDCEIWFLKLIIWAIMIICCLLVCAIRVKSYAVQKRDRSVISTVLYISTITLIPIAIYVIASMVLPGFLNFKI